jgi:hypothetical protein
MADYHCWPLWWDAGPVGNIDPATLGLSPALVDALKAWAATHDATLRDQDPARSGFATPEAEAAFEREGQHLARRLAEEMKGRAVVRYWRDQPSG